MATWLQAKIIENRQWCTDLYSLKFALNPGSFKFTAGQFVRIGLDIEDKLVARPYSLINTPKDAFLEVHFNTVKEGLLSPRLAALKSGDRLQISDRVGGLLTLDEVPDVPHLWLLATGTGVGPFLSMLKTPDPWQRFDKIIMCYSVKTLEKLAYHADFTDLQSQYPGQFHFVPFLTREDISHEEISDVINSRITTSIENGKLEKQVGLPLSPGKNHMMLCGNSKMISEVTTLLEARGMVRHSRREPGQIAIEKYY
ncbi:MAG: ferredoxin--NADP reductase [Thiohalomonadales bacterium]